MLGQTADQARQGNRLERRFWAWDDADYRIVQVIAFAADEHEPKDGYYWVPELGFSGGYGVSLFDTRADAAWAAYKQISGQIGRLERLRANIDAPED